MSCKDCGLCFNKKELFSKKDAPCKKILLMGNPNVGKSVFFSRLTGVHALSSNYPGTTVGFTEGTMQIKDGCARLIDVPGAYTLDPVPLLLPGAVLGMEAQTPHAKASF